MLSATGYRNILDQNKCRVMWQSSTETHRINEQDYEKMEAGLSDAIRERIKLGESGAIF